MDAMRTSAQEDGEEYERQDSTTDEAEHLDDVDTNIGTGTVSLLNYEWLKLKYGHLLHLSGCHWISGF